MSIEDRFNAAVNVIRGLPKNGPYQPSNDMLLTFYSLFKQATKGKCSERKPAFWDVVSRAKWDAWNRLGEMPKETAMQKYVDELKKIVETMSYTDNVANFMEYGDESVNINDLEMVAPDAIQQVRSRPNSPLASRDASPARVSPVTTAGTAQQNPLVNGYHNGAVVKPLLTNGYHHYYQNGNSQSDMSDDEYIDTVDDSETEYPFRPIEAASSVHVSRNRMTQSAAAVESAANRELHPEVTAQLNRAIERLNASVQQINNRINVVEQTIAQHRPLPARNYPSWWPFEEISPRLLAVVILWPLVVNRMVSLLRSK
ncbi:acyl-CoA-binding domain-containing protein 4 [Topomyia yanbarensis]|uniref:acyl-CoA-binding domain-containing protein 4 n=1 Tax=Topomyia yanbarensis TaxID=2498891 RepID=UPI00273AD5C9|nr:acyl-CoA-binding domain-containing protein 4 [Topomyia yanbarensis]